jgi:hypothetical protein
MLSPVKTDLSYGVTGFVLHEDSDRVVIATLESDNEKTGDMVQVWILAADQSPIDTIQLGLDSVICGDCVHAGAFGIRSCYVNVFQGGPTTIYKAWKRGSYEFLPLYRYADVFSGRQVRFGAYGDPCFIPTDVFRAVAFIADGWTGYTHQWKSNPQLAPYLMASCDTAAELTQARADGWRTFRVRGSADSLVSGEITCPASDEGGKRTHCIDCGLCDGTRYGSADPRKDIGIIVHGTGARNFIQIGQ